MIKKRLSLSMVAVLVLAIAVTVVLARGNRNPAQYVPFSMTVVPGAEGVCATVGNPGAIGIVVTGDDPFSLDSFFVIAAGLDEDVDEISVGTIDVSGYGFAIETANLASSGVFPSFIPAFDVLGGLPSGFSDARGPTSLSSNGGPGEHIRILINCRAGTMGSMYVDSIVVSGWKAVDSEATVSFD